MVVERRSEKEPSAADDLDETAEIALVIAIDVSPRCHRRCTLKHLSLEPSSS